MAGSAMFIAEPSKGVIKPARIAIKRTMRFEVSETGLAGAWQIAGKSTFGLFSGGMRVMIECTLFFKGWYD
jgi:hypothetical protein